MDEELNQLKLSIKNFWYSSAVNLSYIDDKLYVFIISNLMKVVLVKLWDLLSEIILAILFNFIWFYFLNKLMLRWLFITYN